MQKNVLKSFDENIKILFNNKDLKKTDFKIRNDTKKIKKYFLDKSKHYLIIKNIGKNSEKIKLNTIRFSKFFGELIAQNSKGTKIVSVKPNINKLKKLTKYKAKNTLRYHQTNIGGSIHSDGPQLNTPPKYIIMSCLNQSNQGGKSIIVNTKKIYNYLKNNKPNILRVLKNKFFFEKRGFHTKKSKVLKKPIFDGNKKNFKFRYLKEYILAGHKLKNVPVSKKKYDSMKIIDKMLSSKRYQEKYKLRMGDMIILNNNILAHGRTGFSINDKKNPREILRIWIKN